MQQLVDLFGFLSVVLRAGTLVFQSLLLGGIVFVLWIARGAPGNPESIEKMQSGSWTLLRFSTIGLIVMQVLYLYVELGCVDDHGRDRLPRSDRSKLLSLGEYCAGGGGGGLFGGTPALEGRTLAVAGAGDDRTGRIAHDEPRRFPP